MVRHISFVNIHIIWTLVLFIAMVGLIFWIYRPSAKKEYRRYSMIPLIDADGEYEKNTKKTK